MPPKKRDKINSGEKASQKTPKSTISMSQEEKNNAQQLQNTENSPLKAGQTLLDEDDDHDDEEFDQSLLLNESMDEIEEESEGVDVSDSIVMLVEDHSARADQRKAEFANRSLTIQNRLQELEETRIRRELTSLKL